MIDVYAVAGAFADKHKLAVDLAAAVMTIEQVPDIPMFRKNTAAFVHDLPADCVANVDGDSDYVRVQVLTNHGALDRRKQLAVVRRLTEVVAAAAGDPTLAGRTWVLLTEAPDGGWGLRGHANTNEELVSAARAQIAELSKNSPGSKGKPGASAPQLRIPAKGEVEQMSEQANVSAAATAADVMRPPLTTVEQQAHVAAAAYLMKHAGTTAVMVLDARDDRPVGIITEADIAHAVADGKDVNSVRIHELMTTRLTVIKPTTSVRDAAKIMASGHFRHLPVVSAAGLVGIVDITDVSRVLLESDDSRPPGGMIEPE